MLVKPIFRLRISIDFEFRVSTEPIARCYFWTVFLLYLVLEITIHL